ncbi:hypothetical protein [Nitrosarchaeum sp. AC2]|uniref:hypothetical protein n=1 Tax=Nitrosarchaeum sp. AC2 TaxID=2259673 RepID=UPI0015C9C263|nr:hypothetical protein [Nitrosarchaeum sp. AC2]QLH10262.1 hypothetical protein DSQ20_01135 [Nitrosarchaeum sp. AC2]
MGITKYNKVVYMPEKKKMRKDLIFFVVVLIFSLSFNLLSLAYAEPQITLNVIEKSYGHDLIIRGDNFTPNSEYLIKLITPNDLLMHLKQGLTTGGDFGVIQPIEFGAMIGNYTVIIETESEKATNFFTIIREPYSTQQTITVEEKEFVTDHTPYVGNVGTNLEEILKEQKERIINESGNVTTASTNQILEKPVKEIPSWVKEVFKMWANGQITDTDLINGIQYLIKIGVIVV